MKINVSKAINELISVLGYAIDIERNKKNYHSWHVAIISSLIIKDNFPRRFLKDVFYAALLHDIGGAGFPYHVIHYLKRHDKTSRNILMIHPIVGAQLTSNIPCLNTAAKLILDHHEWVNGQGYPRAKRHDQIPLGSRILRLADSIDIGLQTNKFKRQKELKKFMAANTDKEYHRKLFLSAFSKLNDNIFKRIQDKNQIIALFNETRERIGIINIPYGIDAVGKTLEVIAEVIDMKHPYTLGHSLRLSRYAMSCALAMGLKHDEVTMIKWSALIHDIGKLSVSRKVLDKTKALNQKEYSEVKRHAKITENIMSFVTELKNIGPIASAHHERFDGSGYPKGLKGDQIPVGARILAVCDAFDAITSNRPYHNALSGDYAYRAIQKGSGSHFDPKIVRVALPLFNKLEL